MRGYDVVIASTAGGNYMMDFFLDHQINSSLWKQQPLLKDLEKLKLSVAIKLISQNYCRLLT
jgi:hypothetical protein